MSKPFKQTFYITDINHNITGIPFFTKYIPTMNSLNSRIHIKNKHTRMKNTALLFSSKNKQTTTIFLLILPYIQSGTETFETTIKKSV